MKFTRLIRDLGILVLFCIGFFLVTRAINLLGEERQETVQVEFSEARRMADRQITRKDFQSAIGFLTKLTDEDEFNSHAWFRLGNCYTSLYERSKKPSLADPTPYSEESRSRQKQLAAQAIAAYMHIVDYPRYRIPAIQRAAAVHILEEDNDAALDVLEMITEFKSEVQNPYFLTRDPFSGMVQNLRRANLDVVEMRPGNLKEVGQFDQSHALVVPRRFVEPDVLQPGLAQLARLLLDGCARKDLGHSYRFQLHLDSRQ